MERIVKDYKYYGMSEFDRHLILYAKGWYRKSDDLLADLKTLFGAIAGMEPEHYSDNDIWEFVLIVFVQFVDKNQQVDVLRRLFRPYGVIMARDKADFKETLEAFVGILSVIHMKNNPLFPNGLGDPNPEYLPLSKASLDKKSV